MMKKKIATCERCKLRPALKDIRFCKDCKKAVLGQLEETGYLKPAYTGRGRYRPSEAMENTRETKFGRD